MLQIKFRFTTEADSSVAIPQLSSSGSVGWDIRANLSAVDRTAGVCLAPGEVGLVSTGLQLELPPGVCCDIRSRSGLAANHSVMVLNSPGTIDPDFRGEVKVLLMNFGKDSYTVFHGERIAQLVFLAPLSPVFCEANSLSETYRNDRGFGSTGRF